MWMSITPLVHINYMPALACTGLSGSTRCRKFSPKGTTYRERKARGGKAASGFSRQRISQREHQGEKDGKNVSVERESRSCGKK
jgi:hypothetical protein